MIHAAINSPEWERNPLIDTTTKLPVSNATDHTILPSLINPPAPPPPQAKRSHTTNSLPQIHYLLRPLPSCLSKIWYATRAFPPTQTTPMMRCVNDEAARRLRHVLSVLSAPQGQQRTNVRDVLQPLEEGHQVHQVAVRRVANPALYGYGIVWERNQLLLLPHRGPNHPP